MSTRHRGPRLRAILAAIVLSVAVPAATSRPRADAAPRPADVNFRVDSANTGTVVGDDLAPGLTQAWSARIGETGYPLIVGPDVLAITQVHAAATVHDISLGDGSFKWRLTLASAPDALLAYGDGVVVVASGSGLVALDVADGHQLWAVDEATTGLPVAAGQSVYVDGPHGIEAVALADGAVRWRSTAQGEPAIAGGRVYSQDGLGGAWVLDADDGTMLAERDSVGSGGVRGGTVYAGGRLYEQGLADANTVLDPATLADVGTFTGDPYPVLDGADLYSITCRSLPCHAVLRAVDTGTNVVRWADQLPGTVRYEPPLADNGYLYLLDSGGNLSVFSEADGSRVWATSTHVSWSNAATHAGMAASDGHLIVANAKGLVAFTGTGPNGCLSACAALSLDPTVEDSESVDQSTSASVDAAHDSAEPDVALPSPLVERWGDAVDGTPSYPLDADGAVFVTVRHPDGSGGTELDAFDDVTGRLCWGPVDLGGDVGSAGGDLAYGKGRLFVITVPGQVQARSAATGALLWSRAVPRVDHVLYVAGKVVVGGFALDPVTGDVEWSVGSGPGLLAAGGGLLFGGGPHNVDALSLTDGSVVWSANLTFNEVDELAYVAGKVIATDGTFVDVLDAETGTSLRSAREATLGSAYDGTGRYVLQGGQVVKLGLTDATVQWSFAGDRLLGGEPPLVVGNDVWVTSDAGHVYELSAATGALEWSGDDGCSATGDNAANLLAAAGELIVSCADRIVALAPPDAVQPEVPSVPLAVQGFGRDGGAYVAWSPPAYPGDGIDSYRITAEPGDVEVTTTNPYGAAVTHLTNGVAHTFTVRAHDAQGWGPTSPATLYPVTPRAHVWRLEPLPPVVGAELDPVAMSPGGHVAVNATYPALNVSVPAISTRRATTLVTAIPPGAVVTAINNADALAGTTVGGGWVYDGGHYTFLPTLQDVEGIDDHGRVAGGIYPRGALIDDHGTIKWLTPKGSAFSIARAMSEAGLVVGGQDGTQGGVEHPRAVEWNPAERRLPTPGYTTPTASAVSSNGKYVAGVGIRADTVFGIVWTAKSHIELSGAYDKGVGDVRVNNRGHVVGSSLVRNIATVWRGVQGIDADLLVSVPYTDLADAVGISDDDAIAVSGLTLNGPGGFVLRPPTDVAFDTALRRSSRELKNVPSRASAHVRGAGRRALPVARGGDLPS